jgi:propionyl-CoA synthetase
MHGDGASPGASSGATYETRHPAGYRRTYDASLKDPETFWAGHAGLVDWFTKPSVVLDRSNPPFFRWYPDGRLNTCYNALDRHVVKGRADQTALIYDSPVTQTVTRYTYAELLELVAAFAGGLRGLGVEPGDRVVIYMPMIPDAVVAMLACARLGAVHSVVFGGFAANELAVRIDDAEPKVVVCATCGIEPGRVVEYKPLLDRALELAAHQPSAVVVKQREQAAGTLLEGRDIDFDTVLRAGRGDPAPCADVAATDPLYILYTSGTTGKPKGIVRDNGGHAVALAWSMTNIYAVEPGQVWFTASDIGWVVGHSYIVYAPLLIGATTVLFEGKPVGTPNAGTFWRVVQDHAVEALFTAPTAIRAIKKEDPDGGHIDRHDLSSLRHLFLAGERLDPETYHWATDHLGIPVIDHWWQTETGWPIVANLRGLEPMPIKAGSPTVPVPGYDVVVLDERGASVPPGADGAICLRLPLPPGTLPTLWRDDERFQTAYLSAYDGYYLSGDGGYVDEDGYVYVMGRTDDVINVAGHRLSTGSMEAVLAAHPDVAECAVIGAADAMKGQLPRGFVVLKAGHEVDEPTLAAELIASVRQEIGPVAAFKDVRVVPALPKTRSGKILRKTMRQIADGDDPVVPSTIEDATVLDRIRPVLRNG